MSIVLGIDTGGTYTDAVVLDAVENHILAAAKSPTTHYCLEEGIAGAVAALDYAEFDAVDYVSLSTTLATNAIVEGRSCRVGLVLAGYEPDKELPECTVVRVPGAIDIRGNVIEEIDDEAVRLAGEQLKDCVDSIAVSEICSVRNPGQEEKIKRILMDVTGLPCVSAHELSSVLGMYERTVTAVLNAGLLSVIDDLIKAVKSVLKNEGIDVPLMIVKGDGSLMTESTAKLRPVETILSGPASSIVGASWLSGKENGLVLDMGGTTTDIAVLKQGRPRIKPEGAVVGGWFTRVEAAEVFTCGLGGDSRIHLDMNKGVTLIGPERVVPLASVCNASPNYLSELQSIVHKRVGCFNYELCEGLMFLREPLPSLELSYDQQRLVNLLKDCPHTFNYLSSVLDMDADFINADYLIRHGVLAMVGFTPTDVLNITGEYKNGSRNGSGIGLKLMAGRRDISEEKALISFAALIKKDVSKALLGSSLMYEEVSDDGFGSKTFARLRSIVLGEEKAGDRIFDIDYRLNVPVIGIGAPVKSWLPGGAECFNPEVVFPDYYYVANAVGAAAGRVMLAEHILIMNVEQEGIYVYTRNDKYRYIPDDKETCDRTDLMERAVENAIDRGKKELIASLDMPERYDILVERKDKSVKNGYNENLDIFIESRIDIMAVLNPF